MQGFNSLIVRYPPSQRRTLVAGAIRARPDLADRITAAAGQVRRVQGYGKDAKDYKEYKGKEIAEPCPPWNQPVQPFIISPLTPQVNTGPWLHNDRPGIEKCAFKGASTRL